MKFARRIVAVMEALFLPISVQAQTPVVIPPGTSYVIGNLTNSVQQIGPVPSAPAPTAGRQLRRISCQNPSNATAFVQVFNAVAANVTLGATAPNDVLPIVTLGTNGWAEPSGDSYPLGISAAATTTYNGAAAPSANVVCSFSVY